MERLEELRSLVDQTLGTLFPPERASSMRSKILARINFPDADLIDCHVHALPEYIAEIVPALQSRLSGRNYRLTIREL